MIDQALRLELLAYLVATNLVSFSAGVLLVMLEFDVIGFFLHAQLYYIVPLAIGLVFFVGWSWQLFSRLRHSTHPLI